MSMSLTNGIFITVQFTLRRKKKKKIDHKTTPLTPPPHQSRSPCVGI